MPCDGRGYCCIWCRLLQEKAEGAGSSGGKAEKAGSSVVAAANLALSLSSLFIGGGWLARVKRGL
jgi:hypothetical protein